MQLSEGNDGGRLLYVYIFTAQVRPFIKKGCALCYIHIYLVGVGVSSCFLPLKLRVS